MTKMIDGIEFKPCSDRGIELKPCPHCGNDYIVIFHQDDKVFTVMCLDCASSSSGSLKKQAIETWNRRAEQND